MRAIANGQVDGFPPADEVRTVFVEADIQGEMSDLTCIEYIFADVKIQQCGVSRDEIKPMLQKVSAQLPPPPPMILRRAPAAQMY
jgi:elongation factor 3